MKTPLLLLIPFVLSAQDAANATATPAPDPITDTMRLDIVKTQRNRLAADRERDAKVAQLLEIYNSQVKGMRDACDKKGLEFDEKSATMDTWRCQPKPLAQIKNATDSLPQAHDASQQYKKNPDDKKKKDAQKKADDDAKKKEAEEKKQ